MADAGRHPRIQLHTNSTVEEITGYIGNFRARVHKRARYVVDGDCTACGDCIPVCPIVVPHEFEQGLGSRRAIYQPFPQAVPSAFLIDMDDCLGTNPIACGKCLDACDKKCIDFDMQDEDVDIEVGTVIVATGMEIYDPTELDEFGYARFENVLTSLEFERLINAGGPTEGHLIRPSARQTPKSIAFIQCVGSRDRQIGNEYCSKVCCGISSKQAIEIRKMVPNARVFIFYIDMRMYGYWENEIYWPAQEEYKVNYVKGIITEILSKNGRLVIRGEDTTMGRPMEIPIDIAILSVGMEPSAGTRTMAKILGLTSNKYGFIETDRDILDTVTTTVPGVYAAGAATGPADLDDSIASAGAAAAKAVSLLRTTAVTV